MYLEYIMYTGILIPYFIYLLNMYRSTSVTLIKSTS